MNATTALKEKLHRYIDVAEDTKVLEAITTLLETNLGKGFELSDDEAKEIDNDVTDYLSGKTKAYTLKDVKLKARASL